ncbi:histidine kinase [Cellvibrio zantedeschiae]|uniref:histidine kinase n=1 Tax=Cellvibrio zantedeschiae TaxID=1237077 RepID=A0ABQ3B1Z1_9GAMM|nr:PAS domain-containing sensor histidine kinase [Cellvibrio zantedeschiae]GGY73934.1 histidine kinase [Cellvibrio zantedeschiae]
MTLSFSPGNSEISDFAESERFRLLVAGVIDYAIYMLSPEGIVCSWNAGAQRFKGYTAEEIIGKHFSQFYTPEDKAINFPAKALQTARDSGRFEDEGWRVRKDGSRFWASVVIDAIRDDDGNLLGFAKITRDITDRKKTAEQLHASEERFRLLVQGVTDYAIYMLSPEGIITNWNLGGKRIKGYDSEEVIGSHFSRFYSEEDRAKGLPMYALGQAASQGRFESEGWRVRKDGSRFWAHVVIDPIRNDMGELIGFAKVTRDTTERRNAELLLEKTQQALFQSQKLEAIGKLTGGIAHDFNNLLGVVMNGVGILRMENSSANTLKVLDSIERSVNRGSALTKQLLTFARQQTVKPERQDLNKIIVSFAAMLRRTNQDVEDIELGLKDSLPDVLIDPAQFESALLNLVINARDAMTEKSGKLQITTETVNLHEHEVNQLPAGTYVKVSTTDKGQGMTQEVIDRALEPFYTTKPVGKGTGLGLSQVYGFVHLSKGDLTIESVVGSGTTIAMYLPALAEKPESVDSKSFKFKKVLVVDDQVDVLDMAVGLFQSLGFEVLAANDGETALQILQDTPDIQVLFSDLVMPEMNGMELAQQAKLLNPSIKVVLASGYAEPALLAKNPHFNDFQFVSKPYRIQEVIEKLNKSA